MFIKAKFLQIDHLFPCLRSWQTWEVSASAFKQKCSFCPLDFICVYDHINMCISCFLYFFVCLNLLKHFFFFFMKHLMLKMSGKDYHSWTKFHSKMCFIFLSPCSLLPTQLLSVAEPFSLFPVILSLKHLLVYYLAMSSESILWSSYT